MKLQKNMEFRSLPMVVSSIQENYTKAIAAGADVCMMGSMFAGCDESPGDLRTVPGQKIQSIPWYGIIAAMENGSKDRYFQENAKKLSSGRCRRTCCYKGHVEDTVFQLMGGLRSGMGYWEQKLLRSLKKTGNSLRFLLHLS